MTKKIDFKYKKKAFSNTATYKLLMTLNIFFSFFCLTLIALYVIGNYQNFLDKTQQIILDVLAVSSIFTALLSIFLIFESLLKIITEKNKIKNIINTFYLFVVLVFCIFCIVISIAINYVSLGG